MVQYDNGCIYLITCLINNKKYIGQHKTPNPLVRWKDHIRLAKKGSKFLLHTAIIKHGEENFKFERICICRVDVLGSLEEYYAEQYGCYMWDPEPGYNMVWCGKSARLGMKNSPEHIEKMRQRKIGSKHTPESIEKIRQGSIGRKLSPESIEKLRKAKTGLKHTPEAIEKMRKTHTGKILTPEHIEKLRNSLDACRANQTNKTGYRNIHNTRFDSWQVQIRCNYKVVFNKTFLTIEEAIIARDTFRSQMDKQDEITHV